MTRSAFIQLTGEDPADVFGLSWFQEIEEATPEDVIKLVKGTHSDISEGE